MVVQSDLLAVLGTTLVVPLSDDRPFYRDHDLVVPVTARESGAKGVRVALVHLLSCVPLDRFDAARSGRVSSRTLARIDQVLRLVLSV